MYPGIKQDLIDWLWYKHNLVATLIVHDRLVFEMSPYAEVSCI